MAVLAMDEPRERIRAKWQFPKRRPSNGVPLFKMGQRVWKDSTTCPEGYESHKIDQIIINADGHVAYRFTDDPHGGLREWPPQDEMSLYPTAQAAEWVYRRNLYNAAARDFELAQLDKERAEAAFRAVTLSKEDKEFLEKVGEWKC